MGDQLATEGTPPPPKEAPVLDLSRARDKGRALFESAFREGGDLFESKDSKSEPKPEEKPEPKSETPSETKKPAAPVDDFADDDDDAVDEFADDDDDKRPADPDTRRRIDLVQRQEARAREQLARERAELERERAAIAAEREKTRPRSKHEIVELLEEMGLDEEEWGILSKRAHARSKDGKTDPKWRDAADREAESKRGRDDLKSLRGEITDLKKQLESRDQQTATDRHLTRYFDAAVKSASDDSPLFKRHLDKNPDAARDRLRDIAREGVEKTGKLPSEPKLIKIYERRRRAELEELGVDVDALIGKKKTKEQALTTAKDHAVTTTDTNAAMPASGAGATGRKAGKAAFLSRGDD